MNSSQGRVGKFDYSFSARELQLLQIAVEDMYVNVQDVNLSAKSIPLHSALDLDEEEILSSCIGESSNTASDLIKLYMKLTQ